MITIVSLVKPAASGKTTLIFLALVGMAAHNVAGEMSLRVFPDRRGDLLETRQSFYPSLFAGVQDSRFHVCGNLGVDMPCLRFSRVDSLREIDLGIAARVYLYMIPRAMTFAVDNFYAGFGLFLDGSLTERISWRFYPVYHTSAHLADGHVGDIARDRKTVSDEIILGELSVRLSRLLMARGAWGYYYHTCARTALTDRFECTVAAGATAARRYVPLASVTGELIHERRYRAGIDCQAGIYLRGARDRGAALLVRVFDRPHPGQYFVRSERGIGMAILFIR